MLYNRWDILHGNIKLLSSAVLVALQVPSC
jgi:hypothetical protein